MGSYLEQLRYFYSKVKQEGRNSSDIQIRFETAIYYG